MNSNPFELAEDGELDRLVPLLQRSPNLVTERFEHHWTLLHRAAAFGYTEMVKHLLLLGADPNALDQRRQTPVHNAAGGSDWHLATLALLVEAGGRVEARNTHWQTPIAVAVNASNVEGFAFLLGRGARLDIKDRHGRDALRTMEFVVETVPRGRRYAQQWKSISSIIDVLLHTQPGGQQVDADQSTTREGIAKRPYSKKNLSLSDDDLFALAEAGRVAELKFGVDQHPSRLELTDRYGWTLLHRAARFARTDAVQMLLECGANPNAIDKRQQTPLHDAALGGMKHLASLHLIAEAGADIEVQNTHGQSPIFSATELGNVSGVAYLLGRGVSIVKRDQDGLNPLGVAEYTWANVPSIRKYAPLSRDLEVLIETFQALEDFPSKNRQVLAK